MKIKFNDLLPNWMLLLKYRLCYNKFVDRLHIEYRFWRIERRLKHKGYSNEKISDIMQRYVKIRAIKTKNESRKALMKLNQVIVETSERTGIPQWEIREIIKSNFHIDI